MVLAVIAFSGGKILTFLVMLSILIVLHEYGHLLSARGVGVRVNEFALGMGPKLFGWTSRRSGTLYSVRALPIGGYCAMQGEDGKTSEAEQQREFRENAKASSDNFQAKTPLQRLLIVLAGPIANFILAFAILLIGALIFGAPSDKPLPIVGMVNEHSPASAAGLHPGDRIVSIDGRTFADGNQIVDLLHRSKGHHLQLVYERDGARHTVVVTPGDCPATQPKTQGCIGILPQPIFQRISPLAAVSYSANEFVNIVDGTIGGLVLLVSHFGSYAGQTTGVIGMGQVASVVQDFGWGPYFALSAAISFALGLFNLLPIPALDGGRAAFIVAELFRGKPVDPEKEAMVHVAGFAALMALMLLVAFHDIARIAAGKGVL